MNQYENRVNHVFEIQNELQGSNEAVIIFDEDNRFYLTDERSSSGVLIITKDDAWLLVDGRFIEEAHKNANNCTVLEQINYVDQIKEILSDESVNEILLNNNEVTINQYEQIKREFLTCRINVSDKLFLMLRNLRMIKDCAELRWHRKAQEITDKVFSHICGYIRPGMSEVEVAEEIGISLINFGSQEQSFHFIVASGTNGSLPHGFASNKTIQMGELVTLDFGAVYNGRIADMTRTIAIGHVSEKQKEIYNIVLEAQKKSMDLIRPNMSCVEIDKEAREYIINKGYGKFFNHRLGHGVGVTVHEYPFLDKECKAKLVPGVVITDEPGIYIPGEMGVRIEDMVTVTKNGFENLCKSPKNLIVL